LPRLKLNLRMNEINDSKPWRFKKWDVRSDGKVFWGYNKVYAKGEYWIEWGKALRFKEMKMKSDAAYKLRNPEKVKNNHKKYKSSQKCRELSKKYERSSQFLANRRKKEKLKRHINFLFSIRCRMRSRISFAIRSKGYSKTSKTREMLGCDWNHFMAHLEAKFVDGMTWGNRHLWHIDHIIPLASATSEEELIKLNHYTNLQPLWAEDNLRKGNRICANVA